MSIEAPPIVKLAERVLEEIEEAVRLFPRYHKYAMGKDLRESAFEVVRLSHRAWRDQRNKSDWVSRLVFEVDDLKIRLQTSQRIRAFRSFAQFEAVARNVSELGRQCGGWNKQQLKGQNRPIHRSERAQILSTRDASQEASL